MNLEAACEIKEDWEGRGYAFFIWHDPPGKNWPPIKHPFDEVVILLEGELTFIVDGERVDLEPGQEIFLPAGTKHSVHNVGNIKNCWCYGYSINVKAEEV